MSSAHAPAWPSTATAAAVARPVRFGVWRCSLSASPAPPPARAQPQPTSTPAASDSTGGRQPCSALQCVIAGREAESAWSLRGTTLRRLNPRSVLLGAGHEPCRSPRIAPVGRREGESVLDHRRGGVPAGRGPADAAAGWMTRGEPRAAAARGGGRRASPHLALVFQRPPRSARTAASPAPLRRWSPSTRARPRVGSVQGRDAVFARRGRNGRHRLELAGRPTACRGRYGDTGTRYAPPRR